MVDWATGYLALPHLRHRQTAVTDQRTQSLVGPSGKRAPRTYRPIRHVCVESGGAAGACRDLGQIRFSGQRPRRRLGPTTAPHFEFKSPLPPLQPSLLLATLLVSFPSKLLRPRRRPPREREVQPWRSRAGCRSATAASRRGRRRKQVPTLRISRPLLSRPSIGLSLSRAACLDLQGFLGPLFLFGV